MKHTVLNKEDTSQLDVHNSSDESGDIDDSVSLTSGTTGDTGRSDTPTARANRRKRKSTKSITKPIKQLPFKFRTYIKEDHGMAIFGIQFNHCLSPGEAQLFATAGSNRVSIYECLTNGDMKIIQCYSDPDIEEVFYTCCWSHDPEGNVPMLAVAGVRGVIRIILPSNQTATKHFIGHGHAINELKFHPAEPFLLLSASKDHSLRLWNVQTDACIAIFGGVEGHRDEVLSADFDLTGTRIMSCGMDHSLKLWRLDKPIFQETVDLSYQFNSTKSLRRFPTIQEHFPDFSTRDVHRNYVDCVAWLGDFILSKSCENSIICWKPGRIDDTELKSGDSSVSVICSYESKACEIWFIRFSLDLQREYMAMGNQSGRLHLWKVNSSKKSNISPITLTHQKCITAIRQTTFSRDGNILICVCDDGTIWRWDKSKE